MCGDKTSKSFVEFGFLQVFIKVFKRYKCFFLCFFFKLKIKNCQAFELSYRALWFERIASICGVRHHGNIYGYLCP